MLSDSDEKELAQMMDVGMQVTCPKIHVIERQVLKSGKENKKSAEPIIVNSQKDQGLKLIDMKTNGIEDRIERKDRMRRDQRIWNQTFSQKS
ncbi:hypothetical protein PPACK8108_LOCUS16173 [Phakopsora pachyrhizi]|uniref:Uncharacterized protein n=1 Tax=Phakopsora pachyrhizi TaxID=170000 RepID=A0AAV0B8X6_PHAPC|nr:hypothetical protein PPACK8108_LOCUS16173 [Phakopsora pachyrhizi]